MAPQLRAPLVAAVAVLIICAVTIFAAWVWTRGHENLSHQTEFVDLTEDFKRQLIGQLESYHAVLRGAAGLYAASNHLSPEGWRAYALQLDLPRNYPGLRALAYAPRVRADELAAFLSQRRAEGNGRFEIRPAGERTEYFPVAYIEPLTVENLAVLGVDHLGDPVRRAALMHARDETGVALSSVITMVGDRVGRIGMLMECPVYRGGTAPAVAAQRTAALAGLVIVGFSMEGLMSHLVIRYGDLMSVRVADRTDTGPPVVLFATQSQSRHLSQEISKETTFNFGGRTLELSFTSGPAFEVRLDHRRSSMILLGGGVLALMLTLLVTYVGSGRRRALAYAKAMTTELRASEERFELVVRGTVGGIWDCDFSTGAVYLSPRVEYMLGYAAGTLGRTFGSLVTLIHPLDRAVARAALRVHLDDREPFDIAVRVTRGDGGLGWFRLRGQAQWDEAGNPRRMAGSLDDITAEREAQDRVERSQAFLTRIIDNLPEPFVVKSRDLRIIVANRAYSHFLGLPLDQIVGRRSTEIWPAGCGMAFENLDQAAFNSGGTLIEAMDVVDAADRTHHVIAKRAPCEGPDGGPALIGLFMDVTAEREALARFESILENTPMVAVVGLDRDGVVMHWNRAATWLYGPAPDKVIGKPMQTFLTREAQDGAGFVSEMERVWSSGLPLGPMERSVRLPAGQQLWIYTSLFPVFRHGTVSEVFCMDVDITERKQAQLRLEESERRFRLMSDSAPVMIWVADADQSCTYVNRAWCAFSGESPEQSMYDGWWELIHPDDTTRYRSRLDEVFEHRRPFECEFRMRRHDGVYRWVLDAGAPRVAADGSFAGFVGTRADITDRREAEEQLRRKRDLLEDLVLEQTADLRRAKETAERANRAKSEFLANMSHELRTPMHAILSYARLGKERATATPEQISNYFGRIHSSGSRLLTLLNDLLDLSKLEAGPLVLDVRPHAIAPLIDNLWMEFEALLAAKQLKFSVDIDRSLSHVLVEAERFTQVLRNLISNAIKFTPQSRAIQIRVAPARLRADRPDGSEARCDAVEIVVSDEGVGIPDSELEAVFDKFVQSSKTRSGAGGTGLGLAICREIINAHGGNIFARNNAAGGVDIVLRLPAGAAADFTRTHSVEGQSA